MKQLRRSSTCLESIKQVRLVNNCGIVIFLRSTWKGPFKTGRKNMVPNPSIVGNEMRKHSYMKILNENTLM